jgi:hypothetical protein
VRFPLMWFKASGRRAPITNSHHGETPDFRSDGRYGRAVMCLIGRIRQADVPAMFCDLTRGGVEVIECARDYCQHQAPSPTSGPRAIKTRAPGLKGGACGGFIPGGFGRASLQDYPGEVVELSCEKCGQARPLQQGPPSVSGFTRCGIVRLLCGTSSRGVILLRTAMSTC